MNRRNLFKAICVALTIPVVAKAKPLIEKKSFLLQDSPLAGFQFYKGKELWPDFEIGQPLNLIREPNNQYDDRAVAVYWQTEKIGYIPRDENTAISQLLDRGETLNAEILALVETNNPWNRVRVEVSVV